MGDLAIYELLRSDGSIVVNKCLVHAIGLTEAVVYSELVSRYLYFQNKSELTSDGYFYNTVADLESGTGISEWEQRKAIKKLVSLELIDVVVKGVPPKRHFRLSDDMSVLFELLKKGRAVMNRRKFFRAGEQSPDMVVRKREELIAAFKKSIGVEDDIDLSPELVKQIDIEIAQGIVGGWEDKFRYG